MKLQLERIQPDSGSSFRILLTPNLNEIFFWHFHPEIEIVYVEADKGIRHVGDHISTYEESDLVLIGSYIPHLNFDYGVKTTVDTTVIQLRENFFDDRLKEFPELSEILALFERVKTGVAFHGNTRKIAGDRLKKINKLEKFEQFIELINILHILAKSKEYVLLNARPISNKGILEQQERMHVIYKHVEENFRHPIDTTSIAKKVNLSVPAFCRYFKRTTRLTYTDFVNQYRIIHAKKLLLQGHNVSESCFDSGFESLSYFNRVFQKVTGSSPSQFKRTRG